MKNFQQKTTEAGPKDRTLKAPSVTQYMVSARDLITFRADTPISEVIDGLLNNRITGAPILNGAGEVVGLIDDKDCLNMLVRAAYYNQPSAGDTASTYMSNVMKSITEDNSILDAANLFLTTPYKRLLITDSSGKLVGQISRRDILTAIRDMNMNTW